MNTTSLIVLTGLVVVVGRWAQGKNFDSKVVIGAVIVIIFLFVAQEFVPEVATPLAALALVAALLTYAVPIFGKETVTQRLEPK
jgi:predicted MFS family arabinose efflux permease